MSERFCKIFLLPSPYIYTQGAPVIIVAGVLLQDRVSGNLLAQLKLRNIQNKLIQRVEVKLEAMDDSGKPLDEFAVHV